MNKLLLIMIDGISSDYFANFAHHMPNIHRLAQTSTVLSNLPAERCGSSLPGRASIITGENSSKHGIYGNNIWDKQVGEFRYASPYDVRIPSLFEIASKKGLSTASVGFGMIKPEDCDYYVPPFWVNDFIARGRDNQPVAISADWKKALRYVADDAFHQMTHHYLAENSFKPIDSVKKYSISSEMISDLRIIRLANALLEKKQSPDLLFTEINLTDSCQHKYGFISNTAHLAASYADLLVGQLLYTLEQHDKDRQYNVIITSDHGHANIETAIYPDKLNLSGQWSSEGSILFLQRSNEANVQLNQQLQQLNLERISNEFLPEDIQEELIVSASKERISFEPFLQDTNQVSGSSRYRSSHSFYPGDTADNRFAVISGRDIKAESFEHSSPKQLFDYCLKTLKLY